MYREKYLDSFAHFTCCIEISIGIINPHYRVINNCGARLKDIICLLWDDDNKITKSQDDILMKTGVYKYLYDLN